MEIEALLREQTTLAMQGDGDALGAVFQYYRPRLQAHALRLCGNTPVAQDVVQDTFISAFTHINKLRDPSLIYFWMRKIVTNHCLRILQRQPTTSLTVMKDAVLEASIEAQFEYTANRQSMHAAISRLSDELRSCVLLRYFSYYTSYEEIATILGVPIGTVRSRLAAARTQLNTFYRNSADANDHLYKKAAETSAWYQHMFGRMHTDTQAAREMLDHVAPSLLIRFTSGKTATGRHLIKQELDDDIRFGSLLNVHTVTTCGNVSVIEGTNTNAPEYPDRCPPATIVVTFRGKDQIERLHFFHSARTPA